MGLSRFGGEYIMKKVFVYYSKTGSGELIAEALKKKGYELIKLDPVHGLPKSFFWQMMIGGMLSLFGRKAKLRQAKFELKDFDEIVVGTPVWNGSFSTPMNTFLAKNDLSGHKLKFIAYSGGGEANKLALKINKRYPNAEIINLKEPKKYWDNANSIIEANFKIN